MRLSADELTELKRNKITRVWRFEEPKHAEPGRCYTTAGEQFTVQSVTEQTAGDVLRTQGKQVYDALNALSDEGYHDWKVWQVRIQIGDQTDRPRLLQPAGRKSGDYTNMTHRAMGGVADPGEALRDEDLEPFAKKANETREARKKRRRQERVVRREMKRLPRRTND